MSVRQDIIDKLKEGKAPKEIATELKIAVGYVYSVRSTIGKVKEPKEEKEGVSKSGSPSISFTCIQCKSVQTLDVDPGSVEVYRALKKDDKYYCISCKDNTKVVCFVCGKVIKGEEFSKITYGIHPNCIKEFGKPKE